MNIPQNQKPLLFSFAAVAAPIAIVLVFFVFQTIAHSHYWKTVEQSEHQSAALMAVSEIIEGIIALVVGCMVGIWLSVIGMLRSKRFTWHGSIAMVLNLMPISVYFGARICG